MDGLCDVKPLKCGTRLFLPILEFTTPFVGFYQSTELRRVSHKYPKWWGLRYETLMWVWTNHKYHLSLAVFFICSYSVRPCKLHLRQRDYPDIYPVHLLALGELMVKWASVMWSLIMIVLFLFHYLCDIVSCMNNTLWFILSLLTRMICVSCVKYIFNGWYSCQDNV